MGLRCSLLGHDYGEAFVERDREERGDEVVVTERELKECARCGSEKVTAENTEVRSLQAERRESADAAPEPEEPTAEESTSEPATAADDGGSASGAFTSATDAIEQAEAGMETDDALAGEPDEDDAVILDDDAGDEPGSDQWEEPAEPEADPEPEPERVGGDAEVVDAGPASEPESSGTQTEYVEQSQSTDLDRERGAWPDADGEDEGFDATETADVDAEVSATETDDSTFEFGAEEGVVEADTGFTSAGPLDNDEPADELDFALYCPECGFERYAAGSSLRAGDICPECQRGYLAEDR